MFKQKFWFDREICLNTLQPPVATPQPKEGIWKTLQAKAFTQCFTFPTQDSQAILSASQERAEEEGMVSLGTQSAWTHIWGELWLPTWGKSSSSFSASPWQMPWCFFQTQNGSWGPHPAPPPQSCPSSIIPVSSARDGENFIYKTVTQKLFLWYCVCDKWILQNTGPCTLYLLSRSKGIYEMGFEKVLHSRNHSTLEIIPKIHYWYSLNLLQPTFMV